MTIFITRTAWKKKRNRNRELYTMYKVYTGLCPCVRRKQRSALLEVVELCRVPIET